MAEENHWKKSRWWAKKRHTAPRSSLVIPVAHIPLSLEHPGHTLGGKMMKIIDILSQRYDVKVDRGRAGTLNLSVLKGVSGPKG